jgi:signal transduction histidine kinase
LIENLEESNAARQRLFAHASHEIKSPLTSIKGFIDIIEYMQLLPPEQQQQLLPAVKKDLNRVIKIANDLLQLARLRDPEYQLEIRSLDLIALLREEHSFFTQKAAAFAARTVLECRVPERLMVDTDPDRLSQILDNLWSNSLKYGHLDEPIRTRLFVESDFAGITIANHLRRRLNIPAERLFEPFYRNPGDADKVTGSGLGLAIVKELTEKLGGKIGISENANTLAITIHLPLPVMPHLQGNRPDAEP